MMSELHPKAAIELRVSEGAPSAKSAALVTQSTDPQPRLFHRAAQVIQRTQLKLESDLQEYQAACASFFASKNNHSSDRSKINTFSGRKQRRLARVEGYEQGLGHSEFHEGEEEEEEEDYHHGIARRGGVMGGDASDEDIASTTSDGSRRSFHSNTLSGFSSSCYTRGSSRRQSAVRGGPRTSDELAYDDENHFAAPDSQRAASRGNVGGDEGGGPRQRVNSATSSHFDSEARARYRDRQMERILAMGATTGAGCTSDCGGEDSYGTYDTYDEDEDDVGSVRHADFSAAEEEVEGGAEGRAASPTALEGGAVLSPSSASSPFRQSLKKGNSTRIKSEDDVLSSNSKRSRGRRRRKGRAGGYEAGRDNEHDGGESQHDSTSMPMTKGPIVGYLRVPRQEALLLQQLRISARANFVEAARREQQLQLQREMQQQHHQKEGKDSLGSTEVPLGFEPPLTAPVGGLPATTRPTVTSTPPLSFRSINPLTGAVSIVNNNNSNSGPNANVGSAYAVGLDNVQLVRVVKAKKRLNDCLSAVGKYSTLCDQLGLRLITFDDVADVLLKKCMAVLDPLTVATDGSCVFYIEGRCLVEAMASMMDTLRRKKAANNDMVSAAEGRLFKTEGISSQQATPAKEGGGVGDANNSLLEENEERLNVVEETTESGEVRSSTTTPSLPTSAELRGLPASESATTHDSQANGKCERKVTSTSTELATDRNEKESVSKEKRDKKGEKKKGGFFSNLFKKQEETQKRPKRGKSDELMQKTTGEEPVLRKDREARHADPTEKFDTETRINTTTEYGKSSKEEEKEETPSSPHQAKTSSSSSACKEPRFSTQGLTPTELQGVHTAVVRAMLFLIETRVVGLVHSSEYQQQQPQPEVQVRNGESEHISRRAEAGEATHNDLEPFKSSEATSAPTVAAATAEKKESELLATSTAGSNLDDKGNNRLAGQWSPDRFSFVVCLDGIGDHGKLVPLFLLMKRMLPDAYPMRVCGIYLLYSHQRHIDWFLRTRHKMSASAAKSYLAKFSAHAGATGSGGKNGEKEANNQQPKKRGGALSTSEGQHHHQSTANGYVPPPLVGINNKVRFYIALQALKVQLLTVKLMRRLHTADDLFGVVGIEALDAALRSANMKGFLPPPPPTFV